MRYGLLGEKLGHSFSKDVHALLGNSEYQLCPLSRDELDAFLRARDFCGVNVTVPYKKTVLPYLDELSPEAARIGAVNTIVNRNGRLCGYNTDLFGFESLCRAAGIELAGRKVVLFGSGGTSLTVTEAARRAGARSVTVVSRRGEDNYENLSRHLDAEILVNTTPVGMFPELDGCVADPARFPKLAGAADVVYNPLETEFIRRARERGVPAANGLRMLVAQAVWADALFFDREPDENVCESVFRRLAARRRNVVLTGMSGCGKSTVGAALAALLDRPLADTDALVEQRCGLRVPEIFAQRGEDAFRALERETVRELAGRNGLVIATGGGVPMDEENYRALRKNGMLVLLKRGVGELEIAGRPKTPDRAALASLWERRRPVYEARCDAAVENEGAPDETARKIVKLLEEFER